MQRIAVVGGGIVGLAVARRILTVRPGSDVVVLEKEDRVGAHQTSHNSGVVHAGLYYPPGSLKAELCRHGRWLLKDYCAEHKIAYRELGKVVVATSTDELPRLAEIRRRAQANAVPGLTDLDADGLRAVEPWVSGVAALHSPATAVVDFAAVAQALAADITALGGTVHTQIKITSITRTSGKWTLAAQNLRESYDSVILCAGLGTEALSRTTSTPPASPAPGSPALGSSAIGSPAPASPASGSPALGSSAPGSSAPDSPAPGSPAPGSPAPGSSVPGGFPPGSPARGGSVIGGDRPGSVRRGDVMTVPFRGEYYRLTDRVRSRINGLVYPVPDPRFPFLGVHLTRRWDDEVLVGPNAVLALAAEGYRRTDVDLRHLASVLSWPGFPRLAARNWQAALREVATTVSKRAFTAAARRYVPELRPADLIRHPAGIRAQALDRQGRLVDDFVIEGGEGLTIVRNAPSPAATSSLAIAEHIVATLT